jgi:LysR family transcriptional regulator, low CO2-responsive transcriptional regulator
MAREIASKFATLPSLTTLKLRVFREVVERQSLTAAAQALFVAQPVVSAHIRSLEEAFGTRLLRRQGRRMLPTEAGQALFNYATIVLEATQRVVDQIGNYRLANRGQLSLGADRTTGNYLATGLIVGFLQRHEHVEIALHIVDQATIENATLNGVYDFAVTNRFRLPPALEFERLSDDRLLLVVAPEHPWARRDAVALDELHGEPFVAAELGTPRREWEERWLTLRGVERQIRFSAGHIDVCKQAVQAGLGAAFLLRSGLDRELADRSLVEVALRDESLPVVERGLIYRKGMHLTPLQAAFLAYCRAMGTADPAQLAPAAVP